VSETTLDAGRLERVSEQGAREVRIWVGARRELDGGKADKSRQALRNIAAFAGRAYIGSDR